MNGFRAIFIFIILTRLFMFTVHAQLTAEFVIEPSGSTLCSSDTVAFSNLSENYNYILWDFGDGHQTYVINPKHIYAEAGEYTIRLESFDAEGQSIFAEQNIQIAEIPTLELSPSSEITIAEGTLLTISASGDFSEIIWSDNSQNTSISVSISGVYTATVRNAQGCSVSGSLIVTTRKVPDSEIKIELTNNILTPNGDGFNDFLIISDFDKIGLTCSLKIYNRFGILMFETDNYKNDWNGHSQNGKLLDSGTYYYIIETGGRTGGSGFIDIIN